MNLFLVKAETAEASTWYNGEATKHLGSGRYTASPGDYLFMKHSGDGWLVMLSPQHLHPLHTSSVKIRKDSEGKPMKVEPSMAKELDNAVHKTKLESKLASSWKLSDDYEFITKHTITALGLSDLDIKTSEAKTRVAGKMLTLARLLMGSDFDTDASTQPWKALPYGGMVRFKNGKPDEVSHGVDEAVDENDLIKGLEEQGWLVQLGEWTRSSGEDNEPVSKVISCKRV